MSNNAVNNLAVPARRPWMVYAPAVVLWALAAWQFVTEFVIGPVMSPGTDFRKHWIASNLLIEGGNPYRGENNVNFLGFNYPMFTALIYVHLAAFEHRTAEIVWDMTNLVYVTGAAVMIAFCTRPKTKHGNPEGQWGQILAFLHTNWAPLVACLLFSFEPLQKGIKSGNIDPLNLLLGTAFMLATIKKRERLAGVMLALFCLVKVAPVLLVLPLVALRRWKLLQSFFITLFVYGIILLIGGWWRWTLFFVSEVLPRLPYRWYPLSISIHRFAASIIYPEALENEGLYRKLVMVINLPLLGAYVAWCVHRFRARRGDDELFLAFGFLFLLLLSPLVELIHLIWVIPALLLHLRAVVDSRLTPTISILCLAGWAAAYWLDTLPWVIGVEEIAPYNWWLQTGLLLVLIAGSAIAATMGKPLSQVPESEA